MNTHETYVSLKTAFLLEKVGFCWGTRAYYLDGELIEIGNSKIINATDSRLVPAPTQAVVQKWLREEKQLFLEVGASIDLNGVYHYSFMLFDKLTKRIGTLENYKNFNFSTFEEAMEVGLQKGLEYEN